MPTISRLIVCAALMAAAFLAQPAELWAKLPALPRAVSPEEAAQLFAKPPAGFEILDIRPQAEFSDYSLPGSLNLGTEAVLADETLLGGDGPVLIVDKDGTVAFALAGVLAQKASRPVLVLRGGLEAWWAARELGLAVRETPLAPAAPPAADPAPAQGPGKAPEAAPVSPAPAPTPPQAPASKSAGC